MDYFIVIFIIMCVLETSETVDDDYMNKISESSSELTEALCIACCRELRDTYLTVPLEMVWCPRGCYCFGTGMEQNVGESVRPRRAEPPAINQLSMELMDLLYKTGRIEPDMQDHEMMAKLMDEVDFEVPDPKTDEKEDTRQESKIQRNKTSEQEPNIEGETSTRTSEESNQSMDSGALHDIADQITLISPRLSANESGATEELLNVRTTQKRCKSYEGQWRNYCYFLTKKVIGFKAWATCEHDKDEGPKLAIFDSLEENSYISGWLMNVTEELYVFVDYYDKSDIFQDRLMKNPHQDPLIMKVCQDNDYGFGCNCVVLRPQTQGWFFRVCELSEYQALCKRDVNFVNTKVEYDPHEDDEE